MFSLKWRVVFFTDNEWFVAEFNFGRSIHVMIWHSFMQNKKERNFKKGFL